MPREAHSQLDILFDVDGVLVHPPFRFRDYLAHKYGITAEMTAPFFDGPFGACLIGKADLGVELAEYLPRWGWTGTVSTFIETWLREDDMPDAVILELVGRLRTGGYKCHVASVQERNRAAYLRDKMGFAKAFDRTFFSCELGAAKPDPAFYARVQEQLAKPPNELLLVDDSAACIQAADRAGWQTFHYAEPAARARLAATLLHTGDPPPPWR